ncbi:kinase-like domain-containing protein [Rhizophagus irregularis DAOM 181602=DAOM 197198]|nr:kinase-like domain-containing protein [Rhizophagus irregularis DAOM 181602=DAOM 197198]POG66444.1 kinase-like domain-containing protein [Rhizophagus irregularis DAOM 181602=DAOM 197198]|eukprot:XP_025173310.1 kinase-like domain-containing protein [Rhizophagus irregularis DAOM 181602=DAOM 197198]
MNDLHFAVTVDNEERRRDDEEALAEIFIEFDKYLKSVDNKVDKVYEEVMYIKKHIDDKTFHGANKIDSKYLELPLRGKSDDKRGKHPNYVVKRIYRGQEVACKSNSTTEDDTKVQGHLEILIKLSECKHILRFYGVSKIDDDNVRVFEWAHYGTLKELYEKKDIQWHYKVRFALNICRGLLFLQNAEILHHDLRCENILITESLEPKIYNFKLARYTFGNTTTLKEEDNEAVRWLAPEKLISFMAKYTTQCEIFSFGILLWELAFEKIPYGSLRVDEIKDFVIKGGREIIKFGDSTPEISKLQENYKEIIINIWKNNPQERISFLKAFDMLDGLYNSISYMFDKNMPALLDDKTLDLDGSKEIYDLVLPDEDISPIVQIIPLDEGIQAYKMHEHQKAWECFEYHAANENITAKYWKGRYLWDGFLDGIKEREEGRELLKEAADEGHPDAQLFYAFTLKNVLAEKDNKNTFIKYITKAAEGNNNFAQFNLGDIYYKGKLKIQKNENEGIKWLRKAALNDNNKAIQFLEEKGISLY